MTIYTSGVFDLFHVGHLRLLKRIGRYAEKHNAYLIVGISTDELASTKGRPPIIPFSQRWEIIESLNIADRIVLQDTFDKVKMQELYKFDTLCVGSDHCPDFDKYLDNMRVIYFPYTEDVSTTKIYERIRKNTT